MGFLTFVVKVTIPIVIASVASFSLGTRLPVAGRWFGRNIGLTYVYFKAVVKAFRPGKEETQKIVHVVKQVDQQALAFQRQVMGQLHKVKKDITQQIPSQLKPFTHPPTTPPSPNPNPNPSIPLTNSTQLLHQVHQDLQSAKLAKQQKEQSQAFYKK